MNCKVIVTCFNEGRRVDFNLPFPNHNQNLNTQKDVLDMLKKIVSYETTVDPGVNMDLVIVNNYIKFDEGSAYLESINGKKLKRGKIIVLTRDNVGGSFGGYNCAFQNTKYENYLFTEDDIVIGGDNYYKKILDKYGEAGFIALIGTGDRSEKTHAHGGVGLASRKMLSKCYGYSLPHYEGFWDKSSVIHEGEIPFTNGLHRNGYEISIYGDGNTWDFENNLCIPYYNFNYVIH